jgi:hypothetical protein
MRNDRQRSKFKFLKVVGAMEFWFEEVACLLCHRKVTNKKENIAMMLQMKYAVVKTAVVLLLLTIYPLALWSQTPAGKSGDSVSAPPAVNWKTTRYGKHLTVRVSPNANLSQYNSLALGTVAYTGPAKKLKPQESAKLVTVLHDSLEKDLQSTKLGSDTAATGTLILDANITKVKRSHPIINVVTIAAVFVPLDLGGANVMASIRDERTGQVIAQIESVGCGQIYQVLGSLQALGQSKIVLKKQSRLIAREVGKIYQSQVTNATPEAGSFD